MAWKRIYLIIDTSKKNVWKCDVCGHTKVYPDFKCHEVCPKCNPKATKLKVVEERKDVVEEIKIIEQKKKKTPTHQTLF